MTGTLDDDDFGVGGFAGVRITGEFDANPGIKLAVYPVKIEGDDILVDVP